MIRGSSDTSEPASRPGAARWRTSVIGGILVGLVFLAVWGPSHEPRPHLPTSDLYTHLTVARHLAQGEGFKTDVTYPLSFAFPFARELPQPLIHRQPGFAVLLTVPYAIGGGDPHKVLDGVRGLQLVLLGMIVTLGVVGFFRAGLTAPVPVWLVLLFANPLLVFAVDWGMVELACALLLLVLWLRIRKTGGNRPGWVDGLLAGMVAMLRLDLVWVPVLWWLVLKARRTKSGLPYRRLGLVLLAWLVITAPWAIRNAKLTGNPVFSLQTYAEHVKDTRSWPAYTVYRQLEPQAMATTMANDPVPVLRKTARGLKFYFRHLPRLAPLLVLLALAGGALIHLWRLVRRRKGPSGSGGGQDFGPMALAVATSVLLCSQYAVFDHSLRHLLVILPVLFWEFSAWIGKVLADYFDSTHRRLALPRSRWAPPVAATVLALALVFIFPCRIPGWQGAAAEAVAQASLTDEAVARTRNSTVDILFVARSAIPWFIDRPVVWNPQEETTRERIRVLLGTTQDTPREEP